MHFRAEIQPEISNRYAVLVGEMENKFGVVSCKGRIRRGSERRSILPKGLTPRQVDRNLRLLRETSNWEDELLHPTSILVSELCCYEVLSGRREGIRVMKRCGGKIVSGEGKEIFVMNVDKGAKIATDNERV